MQRSVIDTMITCRTQQRQTLTTTQLLVLTTNISCLRTYFDTIVTMYPRRRRMPIDPSIFDKTKPPNRGPRPGTSSEWKQLRKLPDHMRPVRYDSSEIQRSLFSDDVNKNMCDFCCGVRNRGSWKTCPNFCIFCQFEHKDAEGHNLPCEKAPRGWYHATTFNKTLPDQHEGPAFACLLTNENQARFEVIRRVLPGFDKALPTLAEMVSLIKDHNYATREPNNNGDSCHKNTTARNRTAISRNSLSYADHGHATVLARPKLHSGSELSMQPKPFDRPRALHALPPKPNPPSTSLLEQQWSSTGYAPTFELPSNPMLSSSDTAKTGSTIDAPYEDNLWVRRAYSTASQPNSQRRQAFGPPSSEALTTKRSLREADALADALADDRALKRPRPNTATTPIMVGQYALHNLSRPMHMPRPAPPVASSLCTPSGTLSRTGQAQRGHPLPPRPGMEPAAPTESLVLQLPVHPHATPHPAVLDRMSSGMSQPLGSHGRPLHAPLSINSGLGAVEQVRTDDQPGDTSHPMADQQWAGHASGEAFASAWLAAFDSRYAGTSFEGQGVAANADESHSTHRLTDNSDDEARGGSPPVHFPFAPRMGPERYL